jgi:hypothetical protein
MKYFDKISLKLKINNPNIPFSMAHNDKRLATFLRLRWKKPRSGFTQTQKCG